MAKANPLMIVNLLMLLLLAGEQVYSGSVIRVLPGFEGPLPFELETGYIGIGESEEVQMFYYFIKSERNPEEDPLLLWLNGGPGCSSFSGLVYEMGPMAFKEEEYNGGVPSLVSNPITWTKVASLIYLDQPVGTGFSYARSSLAERTSDTTAADQVYEFVRKWLLEHPEFVSNPFYISGDSYSGIVVPPTVQQISRGNEAGFKPLVNLKGYLLGNPATDDEFETNYRIPFAHGMGLISDELHESLKRSCEGNYIAPRNEECKEFIRDYDKCVSRIFNEHILIPRCDISLKLLPSNSIQRRSTREIVDSNLSVPTPPFCYKYRRMLSYYWANDESVRKALNVVKDSVGEWRRCNFDVPYDKNIKSSIPYHVNNSIKGFRSLIFSGDHDLFVPFLGTQAWIRSLNYSIVDDWRPWMINDYVAGYTRTYANKMTFATVKGSGHTSEYKKEEVLIMFQRWISGKPL